MSGLLKELWRMTLGPVYDRLFRRYFSATLSRLDELLVRMAEVRELARRVEELDAHVRTVIAARWEDKALARRVAALEDHLQVNGAVAASEPETERSAES